MVHIRALGMREVQPGIFRVDLPSKLLTHEQMTVINELYPNLQHRALLLFDQEALIAAVIDEPPMQDEKLPKSPVAQWDKKPK